MNRPSVMADLRSAYSRSIRFPITYGALLCPIPVWNQYRIALFGRSDCESQQDDPGDSRDSHQRSGACDHVQEEGISTISLSGLSAGEPAHEQVPQNLETRREWFSPYSLSIGGVL